MVSVEAFYVSGLFWSINLSAIQAVHLGIWKARMR